MNLTEAIVKYYTEKVISRLNRYGVNAVNVTENYERTGIIKVRSYLYDTYISIYIYKGLVCNSLNIDCVGIYNETYYRQEDIVFRRNELIKPEKIANSIYTYLTNDKLVK